MSNEITISGKVLFKDKKPINGAKIKIWETEFPPSFPAGQIPTVHKHRARRFVPGSAMGRKS